MHEIRIKDIRKFKKKPDQFRTIFTTLNSKVEVLEKMQRNNTFEFIDDESQTKYYYISKKLLL